MGWQDRPYNRDDGTGGIPRVQFVFPPFTVLTGVLIGVNLLLFLTKPFGAPYAALFDQLALAFGGQLNWQVWRWIGYQYMHGDGGHIFGNMLCLYFFLPTLEQRWGWKKALGFYTLGGIAAGVTFFLMVALFGAWRLPIIGASGAVLACLGAVALFHPERMMFMIIPMRWFAVLAAILYLLTTVGDRDFSDAAHLGGLAFGFFAPLLAGPVISRQKQKWEQYRSHRELESELNEQHEVDRILAKVAESGMNSLTSSEKRALSRATANQKKRDQRRERRKTFI